jgi:hypothetical protein
MNAADVQHDFDRQLGSAPPLDNAHGITLENIRSHCVAPPVFARFKNAGGPSGPPELDAWIVLDECPGSSIGYLVVYCPESGMYALAVKGKAGEHPIFLGRYGSLVETLNAM